MTPKTGVFEYPSLISFMILLGSSLKKEGSFYKTKQKNSFISLSFC
jgi:hypothetical protein